MYGDISIDRKVVGPFIGPQYIVCSIIAPYISIHLLVTGFTCEFRPLILYTISEIALLYPLENPCTS